MKSAHVLMPPLEAPRALSDRTPVTLRLVVAMLVFLTGGAFYAGSKLQAISDQLGALSARVGKLECHLNPIDCGGAHHASTP